MSDDTFTFNRTIEPPSAITLEAPADTIDIGKERELRELRKRVAALTEKLSSYDVHLFSQITSQERHDKGATHGYSCGFHPRVIVSLNTKSVTCQECGAELEPMDVLREFARHERRFVESLSDLRVERARLIKEVGELKKLRSSLRSQVKKKGGTV